MSAIKVTLPDSAMLVDGLRVTFRAPCNCSSITGITIGSDTYTLVDAMQINRASTINVWAKDSLITVLIDVTYKRAYVLNAASSAYVKSHTHTATDLGITPDSIGAAPAYTYGTEDLTAGSSKLETGKLYFVYE